MPLPLSNALKFSGYDNNFDRQSLAEIKPHYRELSATKRMQNASSRLCANCSRVTELPVDLKDRAWDIPAVRCCDREGPSTSTPAIQIA